MYIAIYTLCDMNMYSHTVCHVNLYSHTGLRVPMSAFWVQEDLCAEVSVKTIINIVSRARPSQGGGSGHAHIT